MEAVIKSPSFEVCQPWSSVQWKPRVKKRLDLVGACPSTLAEQVDVGIYGWQDALKVGLPVGMDEAVAQHVVGASTKARWVDFGQAQRLHRRYARVVEVVHEFEPCVGQVVVELGISEQQPNGVLWKEHIAAFEDCIASKGQFEFAARHSGGRNQSDFGEVDLVGRAKIGVRKQVVEIDAELRPKPLAHQITGGGVHVYVNLEEQVVRVQDVRQVEVRPQSHVDVEEVGIAADFHFHEVDRGRVSSWEVHQAWNACPILEVAVQDNGRHLGLSQECSAQHGPCDRNVVKRFHVIPR